MNGRPVGIPPGCRVVHAVPDTEPVTFDLPQVCYAAWLTPELMRETEAGLPALAASAPAMTARARRAVRTPRTAAAVPAEPAGQLTFGE